MRQTSQVSSNNMVAEIELVYRSTVKPSERPQVKTSKECYDLLLQTWDADKIELVEQFKIILLNKSNRVLGIYTLSSGGLTATIADPRLIFTAALKTSSCGIILSHNHPSGNLIPSNSDRQLTDKIKAGGQFLEIAVLDHIIVTTEGYYSFADEGIL